MEDKAQVTVSLQRGETVSQRLARGQIALLASILDRMHAGSDQHRVS